MKIVRYFTRQVSDETGAVGWVPLWIPKSANFDPFGADGMVHDMLEHRLCDSGLYHEEIAAFGRRWALRVVPGLDGRAVGLTPEENLGRLAAYEWGRSSCASIPPAPPTAGLDAEIERNLAAVAEHCAITLRHIKDAAMYEQSDVPARFASVDVDAFCRLLLGWLRFGYRDALRRYGTQDHGCWDNGRAACGWARLSEETIRHDARERRDDSVMRLCWDTRALEMKVRLFDAEAPLPSWLRQRLCHWRRT